MKTLVCVSSSRFDKQSGKAEKNTRYYISSRVDAAEHFNINIGSHWVIENKLYWSLDVTFKEDQSCKRVGNSAANFNLIAKMAMTFINNSTARRSPSRKMSKKHKRSKAVISDEYREQLLII